MRLKLTLVLLLANLVVFIALWRLDRSAREQDTRPHGILPEDMTDLDSIEISGRLLPGNETRTLVKERSGQWRLTRPVDWMADAFAVPPLVAELQSLEHATVILPGELAASGQTLADYGLDNPGLTVTVGENAKKVKLLVGSGTLTPGRMYVMNPEDGQILAVPQHLLESLTTKLDNLRSNQIFSLNALAIHELDVSTRAKETGIGPPTMPQQVTVKQIGDDWQMETPVKSPADSLMMRGLLAQLAPLTVTRFLPEAEWDPQRQGLTNPSMKVTLEGTSRQNSDSNSRQTLLLGNLVSPTGKKEFYAQIEGNKTVFTVAADLFLNNLSDAQDTLRERHFLIFAPDKVTEVTISRGADAEQRDVRIQKSENGSWKVLGSDATTVPTPADSALMSALLENLRKLEAKGFASDAPTEEDLKAFGLTEPQRVVTLQAEKPLTFRLGLGRRSETAPFQYYAKVDGTKTVYEIGPAIFSQLQPNPLSYRDRVLESLPAAAQVESLRLTDRSNGETAIFNFALDAQKTTWAQVLAGEPAKTREAVLRLVEAMKKFQVASYEQDGFTEHFELDPRTPIPWQYQLEAGIRLPGATPAPGQTQTLTFVFSNRQGGSTQFGGTQQPPAVFKLTQPIIDALTDVTSAPAVVEQAIREMDQPIDARPGALANGTVTSPVASPSAGGNATNPAR